MANLKETEAAWRLAQAAALAFQSHEGQTRDDGKTPYAVHVFRVCEHLRRIGGERDEDVLCAALLHDTMEDCALTFENIERQFGTRVAKIVAELTNDNRLPKPERRAEMLRHLPKKSAEAMRVKLADRLDNVLDLIKGVKKDPDKNTRYVSETGQILAACAGVCPPLEAALEEALKKLKRSAS